MKLISFRHREDFGHEWYVQILSTGNHLPCPFKKKTLIQAAVSWNECPGWPYIQIKSGTGSLLSIMFWAYKFGFDIGFCEHTWDWDYMKDLDRNEKETQMRPFIPTLDD